MAKPRTLSVLRFATRAPAARSGAALGLVVVLGGCAAQPGLTATDPGPTAAAVAEANAAVAARVAAPGGVPMQVATLGAGDALGRALYVTDLMLAAAQRLHEPEAPLQAAPSRADVMGALVAVPTP